MKWTEPHQILLKSQRIGSRQLSPMYEANADHRGSISLRSIVGTLDSQKDPASADDHYQTSNLEVAYNKLEGQY